MLGPIEEEEEEELDEGQRPPAYRLAGGLSATGTLRRPRRRRRAEGALASPPGRARWRGASRRRAELAAPAPAAAPSGRADISIPISHSDSSSNAGAGTLGDNKSLHSQPADYDPGRLVCVEGSSSASSGPRLDQQEQLEHYFARIRPDAARSTPYGGSRRPNQGSPISTGASANNRSPLAVRCDGGGGLAERGADERINWSQLVRRYGMNEAAERRAAPIRHSCLLNLLLSGLHFLFPILGSFRAYAWPRDLASDLVAGFTIAVLHIPQGMAYGLLAGVEPIHGLYVSFVPVLVMALMSRSRHVSYGTFAVVSMLLANATDNVKLALKRQQQQVLVGPRAANGSLEGLVLVDNHKPEPLAAQQLLRELLTTSQTSPSAAGEPAALIETMLNDFAMPANIEILTCLCLLVGLIQVLMALVRLGALSLVFSDQLVSSFTCASAIHVVGSQLAGLFDLQLAPVPEGLFRVCRLCWSFLGRMAEGTFNPHSAALSLLSVLFLVTVKELLEPRLRRRLGAPACLPAELVLMAALILASWYWRFNQAYGIHTVGHVPSSLPTAQLPRLELAPLVLQDAVTVALVSFAMNLSLAQMYAKRFRYKMDPNQELFALGTSNVVGSFFGCFPCASSLSRSAVQSNLNVRSPICSLFSCAMVVAIISNFAHILYDLPRSTLSCIIVVALKGILVQCKDLKDTWRLSKLDALVWITTFVSVIAFGVTLGLILGILASLVIVFFRLFTPNFSILGRLPETEIYVDVNCFIDCNEIEQVRIFRFNSALCYLNRTMFKSSIEKCVPSVNRSNLSNLFKDFCRGTRRHLSPSDLAIKFLIIDCSALAYCDYAGASTLVEIIEEFGEKKVTVYLAACPLALVNMIEKMHKTKLIEHHMFPTITEAISQAKYLTRANKVDYMTDTCLQSISFNCQPPKRPPLLD